MKLNFNHLQTTNQYDESLDKSVRKQPNFLTFFSYSFSIPQTATFSGCISVSITSPLLRPSAPANISFKTVDKVAAFSWRVTRATAAVIIFLLLSWAQREHNIHASQIWRKTLRGCFPTKGQSLLICSEAPGSHMMSLSCQNHQTSSYWSGRRFRSFKCIFSALWG